MKKILICFISVIAIIHSLNTVIYNLPTNPTQEKYNKYETLHFFKSKHFECKKCLTLKKCIFMPINKIFI
ncbi:hypothetical protein BK821_08780 [Staphylococcus sp. LCT-H4]|nr:hypothetical protein BK821_08780 [Staphylococcus sp. LCT-H4]PNZ16344.1 hypothetical protein CD109_12080 [Staphylococcus succinus subsp. succinus]